MNTEKLIEFKFVANKLIIKQAPVNLFDVAERLTCLDLFTFSFFGNRYFSNQTEISNKRNMKKVHFPYSIRRK